MNRRNRRSIRLPEYDYSQPGAYHVTLCVDQRENRLGQIVDGEMILNDLGRIAHQGWTWLPEIFPGIAVDVFCVMPNHVHAIIRIKPIDDNGRGGWQTALQPGSLQTAPTITGTFPSPNPKSPHSKELNPRIIFVTIKDIQTRPNATTNHGASPLAVPVTSSRPPSNTASTGRNP